jgi:type I restriction enzyme S subunit
MLQPKLRFPDFKTNYRLISFQDLFIFSAGKNIKQKEASPYFQTPCIRYGELYHMYNEVIFDVINKTNIDINELTFSKGNEILLPSAGEDPLDIGSASALTIKNVAIGRTINILRPKSEDLYSTIYVSYYINQILKSKIASLAKGVSISNVYNSDLKTLEINLPTLSEQQKIASFLSTVDEKINLLKKQLTLLEQYKKGVMQKIFSREIRFKDDEGNEYPEWEEKKFGDFIQQKNTRNKENKNLLVLSISNTQGFILQSEQFENHRVASKNTSNYKIVEKGDVAYNPSRINVGSIAILKNQLLGIVSPMYTVFRLNQKLIKSSFFETLISTHKFSQLVKKSCSGSVRESLNFDDLALFEFEIPSLKEQQKIASFLSSIDEKIDKYKNQISKMELWKRGLLQQMFI